MDEEPSLAAVEAGPEEFNESLHRTENALVPPSRIAFPAPAAADQPLQPSQKELINIPATRPVNGAGKMIARTFFFLLFVAAVAAAFYGGTRYKGPLPFGLSRMPEIPPAAQPTPAVEYPRSLLESGRREVDQAPSAWLTNQVPKELARQSITKPLDSVEPQFLYLYGRASLLSGNYEDAGAAFEQAIVRAGQSSDPESATIKKEATLALAAVSLKLNKEPQRALNHLDEMVAKPANANTP